MAIDRLRTRREFQAVWRSGRLIRGSLLHLGILPSQRPTGTPFGRSTVRLGISVQKKQFPKATQRNRLKRLIRESVRLHQHRLAPGFDLVVIPQGADHTVRRQEIDQDLLRLCAQAGLLVC